MKRACWGIGGAACCVLALSGVAVGQEISTSLDLSPRWTLPAAKGVPAGDIWQLEEINTHGLAVQQARMVAQMVQERRSSSASGSFDGVGAVTPGGAGLQFDARVRRGDMAFWTVAAGAWLLGGLSPALASSRSTGLNDDRVLMVPIYLGYSRELFRDRTPDRLHLMFHVGSGGALGARSGDMAFGPSGYAGLGVGVDVTRDWRLTGRGQYYAFYYPSNLSHRGYFGAPAAFFGVERAVGW